VPEEQTERVLAAPTELFHRLGHFQGFNGDVGRYLHELLRPENTSYRPHSLRLSRLQARTPPLRACKHAPRHCVRVNTHPAIACV
jgi:hypothetical protein